MMRHYFITLVYISYFFHSSNFFFYRKQEHVEMALCPFNAYLLKIVNQLKARDIGEIFIEPVDQNEVPDYGDIVKQPMDLQTMTEKINNFEYDSIEALEVDFNLMISNCLAYNAKHTIFYKSGLRMKEQVCDT